MDGIFLALKDDMDEHLSYEPDWKHIMAPYPLDIGRQTSVAVQLGLTRLRAPLVLERARVAGFSPAIDKHVS